MLLKSFRLFSLSAALVAATQIAGAAAPETVPVGNPGNAADSTGFGAVPYKFAIGKFEVTNADYCDFLNAVAKDDPHHLYDGRMNGGPEDWGGIARDGGAGSYTYSVREGYAKKPVNYVTVASCARYANWLSNGQGKGDTETGPYTINGHDVKTPDHAALAKGDKPKWVIASENEWYKAAYYDPSKSGGAGYWAFPGKSDTALAANINTNAPSEGGHHKDVVGPYGTFDQGGNVWEYNDNFDGEKWGLRGGSFYINDNDGYQAATTRYDVLSAKWPNYGFRIVQIGGDASK